ncbi:MAG: membrane protein insertion efficiency factor YidD [Endomicrobium sp.]|nr:membrane protein insertion efficiency factor YidD [Endomicrobium sp.]
MKHCVLFLIKCYKFTFHTIPHRCRFQPTCSTYAYQAIKMYGLLKGSCLIFKRIVCCNPFCNGGIDPVPVVLFKKKQYERKSQCRKI